MVARFRKRLGPGRSLNAATRRVIRAGYPQCARMSVLHCGIRIHENLNVAVI